MTFGFDTLFLLKWEYFIFSTTCTNTKDSNNPHSDFFLEIPKWLQVVPAIYHHLFKNLLPAKFVRLPIPSIRSCYLLSFPPASVSVRYLFHSQTGALSSPLGNETPSFMKDLDCSFLFSFVRSRQKRKKTKAASPHFRCHNLSCYVKFP